LISTTTGLASARAAEDVVRALPQGPVRLPYRPPADRATCVPMSPYVLSLCRVASRRGTHNLCLTIRAVPPFTYKPDKDGAMKRGSKPAFRSAQWSPAGCAVYGGWVPSLHTRPPRTPTCSYQCQLQASACRKYHRRPPKRLPSSQQPTHVRVGRGLSMLCHCASSHC
jgi:hypothetical protein